MSIHTILDEPRDRTALEDARRFSGASAALRIRKREPELMDQPGLEESVHLSALKGLRRINWISRSGAMAWPAVRQLASDLGVQSLRLLDLACGGGDVAMSLACLARRHGVELHVTGCDLSGLAIDIARARAAEAGITASFQTLDVLHDPLPTGHDIISCSLFLHHLDEQQAIALLRRMRDACMHMVVVNDLVRSRLGYLLAWAGCRVLTRSHVVHVDGPLSVQAAFTPEEVLRLAEQAGLTGGIVRRRWPERLLFTWMRPAHAD